MLKCTRHCSITTRASASVLNTSTLSSSSRSLPLKLSSYPITDVLHGSTNCCYAETITRFGQRLVITDAALQIVRRQLAFARRGTSSSKASDAGGDFAGPVGRPPPPPRP